jgi:hypothetical protein
MQNFNKEVITYYNQYCASPKITQDRRIKRNYINNLASIKEFNKNPFINNNGKKINFFNAETQSYMIVENKNKSIDIYISINGFWCHQKHLLNKNNCKSFEKIIS